MSRVSGVAVWPLLSVLLVLFLVPLSSSAQPKFKAKLLNSPGTTFTEAWTNNSKDLVGGFGDLIAGANFTAAVWRHNKVQAVDPLAGDAPSVIYGINEPGDAVGIRYDVGVPRAFMWSEGQAIQLPSLNESFPNDYAANINDSGDAVGYSTDTSGVVRAVVWRNGTITNLTPSEDTWVGGAFGINSTGQMAGNWNNRAVAWINNNRVDLGTPIDKASNGTSINNLNEIVGYIVDVSNPEPYSAFHWANGQLSLMGNLGGIFVGCIAYDINDHGEAVGECHNEDRSLWRGFIWKKGDMAELPPLTDDSSSSARSINNKGRVVGVSWGGDDGSPNRAVSWK